jgi:ATP-dependent Clp protease ATP-binding subunit ClpA
MGQLPFTGRAKRVLEFALEEASDLGADYLGTEHLLLGLIREETGIAGQVLGKAGVRAGDVREEIRALVSAGVVRERVRAEDTQTTLAQLRSELAALQARIEYVEARIRELGAEGPQAPDP